jgi:hypothetical protein
MLSEYGQEKYNQYNNHHSLSPLELCLYCKSSLSLSIDALRSSDGATTTLAKASGNTTLAKASGKAVRIELNAAEKNTLRNLLFNLQTLKRQMIVKRLKAMSVFDNPLAESLGEQNEEVEIEIKEYTANLDSIMGAEMTTPPS